MKEHESKKNMKVKMRQWKGKGIGADEKEN
jgi:hypothetical protein